MERKTTTLLQQKSQYVTLAVKEKDEEGDGWDIFVPWLFTPLMSREQAESHSMISTTDIDFPSTATMRLSAC
jgi:hypothetical protein